MSLKCGIIGLPNVGKSTLFNAITSSEKAQSANFPFCTIEPNSAIIDVADHRLNKLANINNSQNIIHAKLEFVDIAGLVKGAHKGEGLGNQFLANIREVDALIHVLRCFDDKNIIHVDGTINPISDAQIVNMELIIADLDSLEKRLPNLEKKLKADKAIQKTIDLINKLIDTLKTGQPARYASLDEEELTKVKELQLLTTKPVLYICNVEEQSANTGNHYSQEITHMAQREGARSLIISAQIEKEIALLDDPNDKKDYLKSLNLQESGLDKITKGAYQLLNLQTYFTSGAKETRAWTITKGTKAPKAAAKIHNDFEKGFIATEVTSYDDYINLGGEQKSKEAGKTRIEGKDYIVKDGDIIVFRFNN